MQILLKPKLDEPTRWGSALFMLRSFIKLYPFYQQAHLLLGSRRRAGKAIADLPTTSDLAALMQLADILSPLDKISTCLGAEKYITISLVLPLIYGLRSHLEKKSGS